MLSSGRAAAASVVRRIVARPPSRRPASYNRRVGPAAAETLALRFYSPTRTLYKKCNDDDEDEFDSDAPDYETINADELTDEQIEAILEEEEAKMEAEAQSKVFDDWKPGQRKRPLVHSYTLEDEH